MHFLILSLCHLDNTASVLYVILEIIFCPKLLMSTICTYILSGLTFKIVLRKYLRDLIGTFRSIVHTNSKMFLVQKDCWLKLLKKSWNICFLHYILAHTLITHTRNYTSYKNQIRFLFYFIDYFWIQLTFNAKLPLRLYSQGNEKHTSLCSCEIIFLRCWRGCCQWAVTFTESRWERSLLCYEYSYNFGEVLYTMHCQFSSVSTC